MRALITLTPLFYLLLCALQSSAAPGKALRLARDGPPPLSSSGDPSPSASGSASASAEPSFPALTTSTTSNPPSSTSPPQSTAAPASGTGPRPSGTAAVVATSGTVTGLVPTASSSVSPSSENAPLPYQPQLTAPVAIGGLLLLVSGIVYCFVGIKSLVVQVFISTAYLISLGITVLIVYVMTPPVSPGIQGAYLVAIALPGAIVGAGAVVFKDVTEGLGCAVGGFALGMWLLTLKAGGLLDSSVGKIIFLCCFTGLAFSISFSRYTRSYGIIGCTAFAGATTLILGVDCFSSTGLTEFWLYIWNLNGNLFPLGTTTYPLTRGMKAEIAAIPIAALFGILSQIKIWHIVQDKRAKRAEVQAQKDREREDEEERLGKELEARNMAERAHWERVYGDSEHHSRENHTDSGIGSEASGSDKGSLRRISGSDQSRKDQSTVEVVEMDELSRPKSTRFDKDKPPRIFVSIAEEEEEPHSERQSNLGSPRLSWSPTHETFDPKADPKIDAKAAVEEETVPSKPQTDKQAAVMKSLKGRSLRPNAPAPVVVPLPFNVPDAFANTEAGGDDDASSVATAASSKRMSKRFSAGSLLEKMTKKRMSWQADKASDTSSIRAIVDSPSRESFEQMPRTSSDGFNNDKTIDALSGGNPSSQTTPSTGEHAAASTASPQADYFSLSDGKRNSGQLSPLSGTRTPGAASGSHSAMEEVLPSAAVSQAADDSQAGNPHKTVPAALNLESLKEGSARPSKLLHVFRTNEWAKHLESADVPEEDNIPMSEPPSPTEVEPVDTEAVIAAVKPEPAVVETTIVAAPKSEDSSGPPTPNSNTPPASDANVAKASWPKPSSRRRSAATNIESSAEQRPAPTRKQSREGRTSSRAGNMRSSSGSRTRGGKMRQSSQPLVTSPIHEDVEASFAFQPTRSSAMPIKQDSLLGQRESMMSRSSLVRSTSQMSNHAQAPALTGPSRASLVQTIGRSASALSRHSSNPEPYMQRQASGASMRSPNQPYSPPPPIRTYSPASPPLETMAGPMMTASPITHPAPTASADRPLHYHNNAINEERRTSMLAAWRQNLANEQQARVNAQPVTDPYAARNWMESQRVQREMEKASKQQVGWGTERVTSPTGLSGNAMQDRQTQMMAHDAHQQIMRRMQSQVKK